MQKQEGQAAVSKIIQIRKYFPNASLKNKKDYAEEFKQNFRKLIAYLRIQTNIEYVKEVSKKLPELQNELRQMRATIEAEEEKDKPKPQPVQPQRQQQQPNIKNQQREPVQEKKKEGSAEQKQLQGQLSDAIVKQKPNIRWEDVAGLDQAKKVLQEAVILPMKFPEVFVGERTPWKGILLYGPPGTGKTYLAKACVTEQKNGTFFSVSASDLMSKYVGESQKTLKALFQLARMERPSIIFIDQIDSIAGARSSEENQVSRRVKTQFLIQMQGVGNDVKDVLVLGATNLPWALDPAVRRRFQKRVYIPLPDIKGRLALLKNASQKNNIIFSHDELTELAQLTDGYSCSDLSNLVNDALMAPVRSLDKVRLWEQVKDKGVVKYAPFKGQQQDQNKKYFKGDMQELKNHGYLIFLATTVDDFRLALKSSKPSVSSSDLERYIQFTKSFGMDG